MKIGIVGAGTICKHHLAAATRYPGCVVVGVADRDAERAQTQAARHGVPRAVSSLGELLALKPDVVHVCTPPDSHEALACEALSSGAHVYVEKPMAISVAACANMKATALRAGRQLCVGHSMLYMPAVERARALILSGEAGDVVHAAAGFNYDVRRNTTFGVGHWARNLPGGLAEDLAVHPASMLIHLLGAPQRVVSVSRLSPEVPEGKTADLLASLECDSGLGALAVSLRARPDMALLDVSCTRMMLRLNIASMALTVYRERRLPKPVARAFANIDAAGQLVTGTVAASWNLMRGKLDGSWGVVPLIHRFYAALESGKPVPFNADQGMQVVALVRSLWPESQPIAGKAAA